MSKSRRKIDGSKRRIDIQGVIQRAGQNGSESSQVNSAALGYSATSPLSCFVAMPFGSNKEYWRGNKESNYVFKNIIEIAILQFSIEIKRHIAITREVDNCEPGSITKAILHKLASSDITIVDITGRNANVFFELGIRYALRSQITILLRQESTDIPFDIAGYRCLTYDCFEPESAILAIKNALHTAFSNKVKTDSLVFESFPNMRVSVPGIVESTGTSQEVSSSITWDEWLSQVEYVGQLLDDPYRNGNFLPAAVLGISNGGLLVADLLVRNVFRTVPLMALWANRLSGTAAQMDPSCYYFDTPINAAGVREIKKTPLWHSNTLLLVDDVVCRGGTVLQAIAFIRKCLGPEVSILFVPLFYTAEQYLKNIKEFMMPWFMDGGVFKIGERDYLERFVTSKTFPYKRF